MRTDVRLLILIVILNVLVAFALPGCSSFRTGSDPREFFERLERKSGGA